MGKKHRYAVILISFLAIAGISLLTYFSFFSQPEGHAVCPRMVPNYVIWVSMVLMVLVIVPVSYILISRKLEKKLEQNMKIISKIMDKNTDSNIQNTKEVNGKDILLKFLSVNERKVIDKLIEKKGVIMQSEISRMEGMDKLKTHRTIKELEKKDIVKIESNGKTNKIILNDKIMELMK